MKTLTTICSGGEAKAEIERYSEYSPYLICCELPKHYVAIKAIETIADIEKFVNKYEKEGQNIEILKKGQAKAILQVKGVGK